MHRFANRCAEGNFAGYNITSSSYKIRNLATGRLIERRYADCVTHEPHEVFDYAGIVRAVEPPYSSGMSAYGAWDRSSMAEGFVYDNDNMADMDKGNDPGEYFVGRGRSLPGSKKTTRMSPATATTLMARTPTATARTRTAKTGRSTSPKKTTRPRCKLRASLT